MEEESTATPREFTAQENVETGEFTAQENVEIVSLCRRQFPSKST